MLIRTGVMVGVFQYFFLAQGGNVSLEAGAATTWAARVASWLLTAGGGALEPIFTTLVAVGRDAAVFRESLLTIWIHGALEISSFVLAGGAGLAMGGGLLFPGTLTRWQAFGRSARAGGRILLGTVPLFIIAGVLEGFVTRQTDLPPLLRFLFILCCFAFVLWYYVIFPRAVARRPPTSTSGGEGRLRGGHHGPLALGRIRSVGELLAATFTVFRQGIGGLLVGALALSVGYVVLSFAFGPEPAERYRFAGYLFAELENFHELTSSVGRGRGWTFSVLVAVGFYGMFRLGLGTAARHSDLRSPLLYWKRELRLLAVSGILALTLAPGGREVALLTFLTFPFLVMLGVGRYTTDLAPGKLFRLVYTNLLHSYGLLLLLLLIALPAGYLLDTVVGHYFFAFLDWVIYTDGSQLDARNVMLQAFCYYFLFALLFSAWVIAFCLSLGSLREIGTAAELKQRIDRLGRK
ncbi:hypothetical protein CGL56_12090 [Neolewinella marina]|uniref:Uncharacterized protein n=2 Tax=Neolewinella marina TaxID=438751 RepID=A0A2G0CES8_9BACT|nr:hypothetical protein CGL56_12090 [Neolewinella marina]